MACLVMGACLSGPALAAEGLRGRIAVEIEEVQAAVVDARIGMLTPVAQERFNPVLGLCLLSALVLSGVLALVREVGAEREEKMQSDGSALR